MKHGLAALAVVLALAAGAFALHERAAAPEATVTYYVIPGCSTCAHTADALEKAIAPYGLRVQLRIFEYRSPQGIAAQKQYHFLSHGLVLTDAHGQAQLVESDHRVFPEHVVEALGRILPAK